MVVLFCLRLTGRSESDQDAEPQLPVLPAAPGAPDGFHADEPKQPTATNPPGATETADRTATEAAPAIPESDGLLPGTQKLEFMSQIY